MQWGKLMTWSTGEQLLWIQAKQVRQPDLVVTLDNKPLACALALHLLEAGGVLLGCWGTENPAGTLLCKPEKSLCPFRKLITNFNLSYL